MTIEGFLLLALSLLLLLNWPVAFILIRAARQRPRIKALTVMAVISLLVAVGLTAYILAVANAGWGYILPKEWAQAVFRAVLIGLALFPLWFLWLYRTGRFDDRMDETEQETLERHSQE